VGALAADCTGGAAAANCENANCEMIGTTQICTSCQAGYVPINGKCTAVASAANCKKTAGGNLDSTDKTCGKCEGATFMYKGGCYDKEGEIGRVICKTPGTTPGVCNECQAGYFKNSSPSDSKDSCTACTANCNTCSAADADKCSVCAEGYFVGAANDAEGACIKCDAGTSNGWTGVTGCAKCTKPAAPGTVTCDECTTDYLKTDTTGSAPITTCVTADNCGEGFFATTVNNIKKCVSCSDKTNGVDGCEKCTAPGEGKTKPTCTKCSTKYLKTVSGVTTCETDCGDGYFKNDNGGSDSQTKVCVSCSDTNAGVPNCAKCTAPSTAGQKPACSECGSGFKLEGGTCVSSSANRSGLSTGAIAGISVAAVVVVGGLVGFLCWWFVCRGKA
ncbi:Variant-specific surface protein, partial [Giardia duodenalis]